MSRSHSWFRLRRAALAAAVVTLSGCASSSTSLPTGDPQYVAMDARTGRYLRGASPAPGRPSDEFPAAPDRVWAVLPTVYGSLGLTPTARDDQGMIVGVQNVIVRTRLGGEALSRALECGLDMMGPTADRYEVHLTILSKVRSSPSGSAVDTRVTAWATPNGLSTTVECRSTGRIEDRIAQGVQSVVGGAGTR